MEHLFHLPGLVSNCWIRGWREGPGCWESSLSCFDMFTHDEGKMLVWVMICRCSIAFCRMIQSRGVCLQFPLVVFWCCPKGFTERQVMHNSLSAVWAIMRVLQLHVISIYSISHKMTYALRYLRLFSQPIVSQHSTQPQIRGNSLLTTCLNVQDMQSGIKTGKT